MNLKLVLNRMSPREQMMVLITCLILVGGAYTGFRFIPANKAIADTVKKTASMEKALKTGKIPEEPTEDMEDLRDELEDLQTELEEMRRMAEGVNAILPSSDTTEIRLAISDLARTSGVTIKTNEEYRVVLPLLPVTDANAKKKGTTTTKKKETKEERRARKEAERAQREAQRAVRRAAKGANITGIANVKPEHTSALVRKLAVNGSMERPLQRLTAEGTYAGIQRFINDLEQLDRMVTVVYMQLAPTPRQPQPGYNQRITASLVLAL
jgi:Tfp pilus assembly protein PilO